MSVARVRLIMAVALTAAVVAGVFAVVGFSKDSHGTRHSAGLTPPQVVQEYLRAVAANNPAAAEDLTLPDFLDQEKEVEDSWFGNSKISNVKIKQIVTESFDPEEYNEAVSVWVEFDLTQKKEVSMENGSTIWSFLVVKKSAGDRWRIADSGI